MWKDQDEGDTANADSQASSGNANKWKNRQAEVNLTTQVAPTLTFKVECKDLPGAIFDVGARGHLDQHVEGAKKICKHVASALDCGGDVRCETENVEVSNVPLPGGLPADASDALKQMQPERMKTFTKREEKLRTNCTKVFALTHWQHAEAMKAKLQANDEWQKIKDNCNLVELSKSLTSCTAAKAKNILVFQRTMQRKDGATHTKKMGSPMRAVLRDTRAPQTLWSSMRQHAQMNDMILCQFVVMLTSCQPILCQLLPSFDCCQLFLTLSQQRAETTTAIHACGFLDWLPSSDQLPSQPTMSFLFFISCSHFFFFFPFQCAIWLCRKD